MWSVCGISFLTVMASAVNAITVNPTYPLKNGVFTLTAAATGSSFTWVKDSTVLTACTPPINDCDFPTPNSMPNAIITVDGTAQVSTISVSNASQMLNGGLYGATGSVSETVIVSTLPTSVQWKSHPVNGSSVDTGKWIAETSCVYPYDNITIDFKIFVEGVLDSVERISTSSKPESCVSPERVVLAELELYSNEYANERVYIVANASHDFFPNLAYVDGDQSNVVIFTGPTVTTEMSSTSTGQDQTTSSQYPSIDYFHNTQQTETTIMTTTDNGLTSTSLHVSSEVTTPIKTKSDNLTDLGFSAIIAIAISGFIFLFLIIILTICCCQYYRKKSKRKTSGTFQEIHDDAVPTFWPNFNGQRYGMNGINGSTVHVAHGYTKYQGESEGGYNVRSKHQFDNYNRSKSNKDNITENRKRKPKQVQGKTRHEFPQSIPDDIMNRYDINGIKHYDSHDNNKNTRTYYRGQAVLLPRRFEYPGSFLPQEYITHNRRSSPYMTYLHEHVLHDLEGLTIYQGHTRATKNHARR